ncbi:unnamed protein product [Lymnaea stagnalis]|uniref:CHHC U11-48K-type domain-containing protein n=1 Tax=Lymnaea stagnalis TaxID=6523 RepID=A0AAV2HUR1_LYMST
MGSGSKQGRDPSGYRYTIRNRIPSGNGFQLESLRDRDPKAMLSYNRGDETIICPYDETHSIQKKSFQAHIIKCREAHQGKVKMVVCKFDKTHVVPKPELKHHMKDCPSRSVLDRDMQCRASIGNALTGDIKGPAIKGSHSAEIDEDWDSAPQMYRTPALFNKPDDYYPDEDEMTPYIPPGANYVGQLSPKKLSQPCEESSEQIQRKVPMTQSKAAQLSESAQLRNSNSIQENSVMLNNVQATSEPSKTAMRGTSAYVQDDGIGFSKGRSRGLIAVNAPTVTAGLSFGRGVSKYASSLTKPAHQPWVQSSTHHPPSDLNSPTTFSPIFQPPFQITPAHSSNSSQMVWSPETFSDVSSDYSSHQEIPASGFTQVEEMAAQRNKALSAKQARELEELLRQHEQEHQLLLIRQEQERALLLQKHEKERALAHEQHEQLIRRLLLPLSYRQGCRDVSSTPDPSLASRLELLSLDQQSKVKTLGSYAKVLSTKSEASSVQSESWCVDETESESDIPERLATENIADSTRRNKDYPKMSCEELKQQKKKMEKKLKQIGSIEARFYRGEKLLAEEETKLKRKTSILKDLESISQYN